MLSDCLTLLSSYHCIRKNVTNLFYPVSPVATSPPSGRSNPRQHSWPGSLVCAPPRPFADFFHSKPEKKIHSLKSFLLLLNHIGLDHWFLIGGPWAPNGSAKNVLGGLRGHKSKFKYHFYCLQVVRLDIFAVSRDPSKTSVVR
jgi:hypothetical protein